jgi:hypothetical protein
MTAQYIIPAMNEQAAKTKVMKAWRLHPDIVEAIKRGHEKHGYPDETAYVEAIFRRVLGLPERPEPEPLRVTKQALELRA